MGWPYPYHRDLSHLPYKNRTAYPLAGDPLDPHEKTVIRLVGDGKTDAEIVELMKMTEYPRLLPHYFERILMKLGLNSRDALRVWAEKEETLGHMEIRWRSFRFDSGEQQRIDTSVRRAIRLMEREISAEAQSPEEEGLIRGLVVARLGDSIEKA